jgi:hypothetical protein
LSSLALSFGDAVHPFTAGIEGARAFVLAHGSLRERARLQGILLQERPSKEVVKELESLQNSDGGFPLGEVPGRPSSIDTTCAVLDQCKELPPLAGSPMASRAAAFLRRMQRPDGSWAEAPAVQALDPLWGEGESAAMRTDLTVKAAYTAVTLEPDHLDPMLRAARWLEEADHSGSADVGGGPAAAFFYQMHRFDRAERILTRPGPTEKPAALSSCLAAALEVGMGGRLIVPLLSRLHRLAAMQGEDGAWPAEPGLAVETTLGALRVFMGFGLTR